MRKIEAEIVEKKRKAMLKNLKGRTIKTTKQANRSLNSFLDVTR